MKTGYLVFLLATFLTITVFAQQTGQNISGNVTDAVTGNPIPGATVIIQGSSPLIGTSTDTNGEFALKNIEPGRYTIVASIVGYHAQALSNLMLNAGKELQLNFKLSEKVTELTDFTVRANSSKTKAINQMALLSTRSFSIEETERFAGSLGDPARMVANFAGVIVNNDTRNDIIIRGNSPMGVLWKLEGVDVANPNHFGAQGTTGGPVSMLNNNLLANSDFMTGAFTAEYGNALSGVFDLNLRSGNKDKYEFTGQIGFNGFEAAIEGPVKIGKLIRNGSFLVDYRYSTLDLMSKMGLNMGTGTAIPKYQDLSLIVDLPTTKAGRFKLIGLIGKSFIQLGRSFEINESTTHNQIGYATDFGANLNIVLLTHTLMLSENTRLKSSVSFQNSGSTTQNDTIDYVNKNYFENYAGELNENKLSVSTDIRHKINSRNNISVGLSANNFHTSFNDSAWNRDLQKRLILTGVNNRSTTLYQSYVNWQHRFTDQLLLNTGLHYQLYSLNYESALEPRTGIKWSITNRQSISAGYGLHSQIQPRTVYFDKHFDTATGIYSEKNHDLKFTRSHHFVLGYDINLNNSFRIKAEAYHQMLFNVPVSNTDGTFSMLNSGSGYYIADADSLINTGKGRNSGIELTIEKFLEKGYYALLTISLYDSKYKGTDNKWRNTAFNSGFALNALAGYELKTGKNNYLTFDVRAVWSGGMRYIPINLQASIAANEQVYDLSESYNKRYNDYFRTDLRIGYKFNRGKITQEWAVDLQNVTNHKNLFAEQYNNQLKEITSIYQQGFMPMMLYRINF